MADQTTNYIQYLKRIKGLSDRSIYHYLSYHRHFRDKELTQKHINKFITSKNNNSVCRGYMNSYLEFLKRDREFDIPKTKTGTAKKRLIRPISYKEMEKIIAYGYAHSKRNGLILDILYYGALRRFEINTIAVNLINFEKWFDAECKGYCELSVIGKGDKERIVLMHPRAIKEILNIYLDRGVITSFMEKDDIVERLKGLDDPLFKHVNEKTIYLIARESAKKSIGRPIRTHEIRHARATYLQEHGAGIRAIQKYLGHATLSTTEIYLHDGEVKALNIIRKL
jgi:site-specific recombinase XerD